MKPSEKHILPYQIGCPWRADLSLKKESTNPATCLEGPTKTAAATALGGEPCASTPSASLPEVRAMVG